MKVLQGMLLVPNTLGIMKTWILHNFILDVIFSIIFLDLAALSVYLSLKLGNPSLSLKTLPV